MAVPVFLLVMSSGRYVHVILRLRVRLPIVGLGRDNILVGAGKLLRIQSRNRLSVYRKRGISTLNLQLSCLPALIVQVGFIVVFRHRFGWPLASWVRNTPL